ncbi:MAG: sensor histidine kinase [Flavobacteriia bacterium]|jgi:two-component sensor histidine kinase
MIRTIVCFLVFSVGATVAAAQSRSYIDKLNVTFFERYDKDIDEAYAISMKALNLSRKIGYKKGEGGALYRIGIVHDIQMNADSARMYLFQGISILKETNSYAELGDAYNNLGAHYYYQFDYYAAIRAHKKAIKYFKLSDEPGGASRALNNIGICYKNLKQPEKALDTYYQSLKLGKELNDPMTIAIAYASISGLYIERNEFEQALKYNFLSEGAVGRNDNYTLITILFSRGEILMKMGSLEASEAAFELGRKLAVKTKNLERLQYFYKSLAELRRAQDRIPEAFDYLAIYDSLRDEMYNRDRNEFMAEYEKKFELSEKELETTKERLQRKQVQEKLTASRRNLTGALITIALLMVLVALIAYAWKQRKEKNELDRKHIEEIDLLSKELHHRIKNNLQLVASMLSIETRELDAATQDRINNVINAMQIMSRIHESLYGENGWDSLGVRELLETLKSQGESLRNDLSCEMHSPDIHIDLNTGISIGLLINELMTNSVKHAFNDSEYPRIEVTISQEKDHLLLTYMDNGSGLTEHDRADRSFGSTFLKALCRKLGGELSLRTGNGYFAELKIRKYSLC